MASRNPKLVRLEIVDDDTTPFPFVVRLLTEYFGLSEEDALTVTESTHATGRGEIGEFERPTANNMLRRAREACLAAGHTLAIEMEEVVSQAKANACSFCGKPPERSRLQYSRRNAAICDECVLSASSELDGAAPQQQFKFGHQALSWHFAGLAQDSIVTAARQFPARMRPDLQIAVNQLLTPGASRLLGINREDHYTALTIASLMKVWQHSIVLAPTAYDEVDIGEDEPVRCLENGLWLSEEGGVKYAVLLTHFRDHFGQSSVRVEIAVPAGEAGAGVTQRRFRDLEAAVSAAKSYRGKVLSLEQGHRFAGTSGGILVHRLPAVSGDEVVLPETTFELLRRNILAFAAKRENLRGLGLSTKKGILLYGPPGTGKTHTIRYLASNLPGHTTLLITAEQIGLMAEYFALARLLQPSLVVIEDVDLIARDRPSMHGGCEEVMLNGLLNEMDGLKEETDVFFVLTTNRPEMLEAALASRPGRIDQAIEVPLPDDAGRAKLIRLYGRALRLGDEVVALAVRRTKGVSAAFIKELMRRVAQGSLERGGEGIVSDADTREALEEMLFTGGRLNAKLLGGASRLDTTAEFVPE